MCKKLNCILLIDDNADDNFFHERVIRKSNCCSHVISKFSAQDALNYLLTSQSSPDLILLDINMPGMNGWEFLDAYHKVADQIGKSIIIVMLTTSINPDDMQRSQGLVADFRTTIQCRHTA